MLFGHCFFENLIYCVLRSHRFFRKPRIFIMERDVRGRAHLGAAPGLVFHERGFAVPLLGHGLGVRASFQFVRH